MNGDSRARRLLRRLRILFIVWNLGVMPIYAGTLFLAARADQRLNGATPQTPPPRAGIVATQLRDGDLIFQESTSRQSEMVRALTNSRWTHMGVVFIEPAGPVVLEAVSPVSKAPLQKWIAPRRRAVMDDLDREIEIAQREARRRVWRGRFATIASTATFLVVGVVGTVVTYQVFPDVDERELDARLEAQKAAGVGPSASLVLNNYAASERDRNHVLWRIWPVMGLAFASAVFVSKRLRPCE